MCSTGEYECESLEADILVSLAWALVSMCRLRTQVYMLKHLLLNTVIYCITPCTYV